MTTLTIYEDKNPDNVVVSTTDPNEIKSLLDNQPVSSKLDALSKVKPASAVAYAPQVQEVVKEVVKYVQPEPPARATIGVFRGIKLETYDVPRQK